MRALPCLPVLVTLALAACKGDPDSLPSLTQTLRSPEAPIEAKLRAVERLCLHPDREAVPVLVEALKPAPPQVKAAIAQHLADQQNPAAIGPLAEALEPSALAPDVEEANRALVRALGALGAGDGTRAAAPLVEVARTAASASLRTEALEALGRVEAAAAARALPALAFDEALEPALNKRALRLLGERVTDDAVPTLLKGLFFERGGATLAPEATLGLLRAGPAASQPVRALLTGMDSTTLDWARGRGFSPAAVLARAARLAGDLRDPRAVPELIRLLSFRHKDLDLAQQVRSAAAESLGRMRAREAVPALVRGLSAEVREAHAVALVRIGERRALPRLVACARKGAWRSREACARGVAGLGGKGEARLFAALISEESKRFEKECRAGDYGGVDCWRERPRLVEERARTLRAWQAALLKVGGCEAAACLGEALASEEPAVREKAALAAAQRGEQLELLPALVRAIERPVRSQDDLPPRLAAVLAVDWLAALSPSARARAQEEFEALRAVAERDTLTAQDAESAEEIRRLIVALESGREVLAPEPAPAPPAAVSKRPAPEPRKAQYKKTWHKKKKARKRRP